MASDNDSNSVTIPAARVAQIDSVMRKFVASFLKPIDSADDFVSIFHPDIEWYDHAFLIRRVGHTAVMGLHRGFTHCNQPFDVKVKAILPTSTGGVLEQIWIGQLSHDLIRPDGQIAIKASGKDFVTHVCMPMQINQEGLITRIDEYYNKSWDDGVAADDYLIMKGPSMKAGS